MDAKQSFDQSRAEQFADKMVGLLNNASLSLMVSIGHRTGLFDKLATLPPSTSEQIAAANNLNERYVREWLGAMVTGRIMDYQPADKTYSLAPEHAAFLTRGAGADNLAMFTQYIGLMGGVEDKILECFYQGGGVPYSEYPRFQEVMSEDSGVCVLPELTRTILPLIDGIEARFAEGIEVLDVGCGSGKALNLMAKTFPNSNFTGYDFSETGIANGRAEAESFGLTNIKFEKKDVTNLGEIERFDLITAFDAIHDQAQPRKVLRGICQALKPDGTFLMVDIKGSSQLEKNLDHLIGPFLYTISTMHCMTVSLALNGEGLGTMWGEEKARELLAEAGFTKVEVHELAHDIQNSYYLATKN
jgi:2-polyprenyl-3-methyl-5-hydroxy-6-metoxy-1,4-benzoquinol methylase